MSDWTDKVAHLVSLEPKARERLRQLSVQSVPEGAVLFTTGESAKGFVVVLSGRIEVYLTGPSGREILLYGVEPGQSCIQSTLGLLGGAEYSGEAITASPCQVVMIPRGCFLDLLSESQAFQSYVFTAFAGRVQALMSLLERVVFQKVEARLAAVLLQRQDNGVVRATHQDLAVRIGTVREVISRRLEAMAKRGWVTLDRGVIMIRNPEAIAAMADDDPTWVT